MKEEVEKLVNAIINFYNDLKNCKLIGELRDNFIAEKIKEMIDKSDILGQYEIILLPIICGLINALLMLKECSISSTCPKRCSKKLSCCQS